MICTRSLFLLLTIPVPFIPNWMDCVTCNHNDAIESNQAVMRLHPFLCWSSTVDLSTNNCISHYCYPILKYFNRWIQINRTIELSERALQFIVNAGKTKFKQRRIKFCIMIVLLLSSKIPFLRRVLNIYLV